MGKVVVAGALELLDERMAMGFGRTLGRGRRVSLVMCCMQQEKGFHIRFWHDLWSSPTPLKELYLELFACVVDKEARISNMVDIALDGG